MAFTGFYLVYVGKAFGENPLPLPVTNGCVLLPVSVSIHREYLSVKPQLKLGEEFYCLWKGRCCLRPSRRYDHLLLITGPLHLGTAYRATRLHLLSMS